MRRVLLRFLAYAIGVTAVMAALVYMAGNVPGGLRLAASMPGVDIVSSELSPVELMQDLLLLCCAGILTFVGSRDRLRRPMAFTLALFLLACLVRELDFFLDFYFVDNLWQVLCALIVSLALVYGVRNRERIEQGWRRSWPSTGLAMVLAGFILLVPFAQLVGHEALWRAILGADYVRVVKVAVEELVELGAYALITLGTLEFVYVWSRLPRPRRRKRS